MADVIQEPLSEEAKKRLIEWITSRWANAGKCSVCGVKEWQVGTHAVALMTTVGDTMSMNIGGSIVYPVVPLMCKNCGNTTLINAFMSGIIKPKAGEASDAK